jgi:hypothetical protein
LPLEPKRHHAPVRQVPKVDSKIDEPEVSPWRRCAIYHLIQQEARTRPIGSAMSRGLTFVNRSNTD